MEFAFCMLLPLLFASCYSAVPMIRTDNFSKSGFIIADGNRMQESKALYQAGDSDISALVLDLVKSAENAMKNDIVSVTDNDHIPPSGNIHDYYSLAVYWWPNKLFSGGKPYIMKDGKMNPEYLEYDLPLMIKMSSDFFSLSLAFFYTENNDYALRAAEILRHWFIDPETAMNPNLEYAQAIPGICSGTGTGIIESVSFPLKIIDGITLMKKSSVLTDYEFSTLKNWFGDFLEWLVNSGHGREQALRKNNLGTYYWMEVLTISLFINDQNTAEKAIQKAARLIQWQIKTDGSQPAELRRTKSFDYSVYNLEGWFYLAAAAENLGYNFWEYEPRKGCSIESGLEYLAVYLENGKKWPYRKISDPDMDLLYPLLNIAGRKINPSFSLLIDLLPDNTDLNDFRNINIVF